MKKIILLVVAFVGFSIGGFSQVRPSLGTAADFTILAATGIYNKDVTRVSGNLGVWPGNVLQGFTAGMINGTTYLGDAAAQKAQADLEAAYNSINGLTTTPGKNLTGTSINGQILGPGIYTFDNTTTLSGTISLDAANDPNAIFIFQVKGGLITAANTTIRLLNNARRMNIFWQVTDTVNIGARANMAGSILAKNSIRLGKEAVINGGRLLSLSNKVVLNKNNPVTTSTDLGITKTKSLGANGVNPYSVGEEVTFTIVARNYGPINDYNVKIVDQLDIDLEYLGATAQSSIPGKQVNTFSYNRDSRVFQWIGAEFRNGETVTLTIKVKIKNSGGIGNTATILGTVTDDNFDNNSASIVPAICAKIPDPGTLTGPTAVCFGSNTNVFSVAAISGVQSYTWVVPSGWRIIPNVNGEPPSNTITVEVPESTSGEPVAAEGIVSVTVNNGCGDSDPAVLEVTASNLITAPPGPITTTDPDGLNPCIRTSDTYFTYRIDEVPNVTGYEWVIGTPADSTDKGGWQIVSGQNTTQIRVKAGQKEVFIWVKAINICGPSPASFIRVTPSVTNPTKPTAITGPTAVCVGSPSGVFTVTNQPGTRYIWTVPSGWSLTGQGTNQISVTAPVSAANTTGTITVAAANNCGTSEAVAISVTAVNTITAVSISSGSVTPCVNATVVYRVQALGATSFTWQASGNLELVGSTTADSVSVIIKPGGGTLSVILKNDCGANQKQSVVITPPVPISTPASIQAATAVFCTGTTGLVYSVAEVSGASGYAWKITGADGKPAAGWRITATSPDQRTITVTAGSEPAIISVSALSNCGASTAQTLTATPVKSPPPVPGTITGNANVCAGNTNLRYSIKPVPGATSYTWTIPTGSGWAIVSGQGTTQILVKAGATEGFITVRSKNICGESAVASQKAIVPSTAKPPTPGAIVASKTSVCINEPNVTFTVPAIPGVSLYAWTVPEGWAITSGQTTNSITVTAGSTGGSVYVVAYNNCGPGKSSTPLAVAVNDKPTAPVAISGETIACSGSVGNKYKVPNMPGATSYVWSLPTGWTITAGAGTSEITVAATDAAGTISVRAKNACFESDATTLAVKTSTTEPATLGPITGSSIVCRSQSEITYQVTPNADVSNYTWSVPPGWSITSGQGTPSIKVLAANNAGIISVLAKNGCGVAASPSSLPVSVSEEVALTPGAITGKNQVCGSETNLTYTIAEVNGASGYLWEVPEATGWQIVSGQGTTSITVRAGVQNGAVRVKAIGDCGPGPASTFAVNVSVLPTGPIQIIGTKEQCAGSTEQVYQIAAIPGAVTYTWQVPPDWVIEGGQGTPAIRVTVGETLGTVQVIATAACSASITGTLAVVSSVDAITTPGPIGGDSNSLICSNQTGITYSIEPVPGATAYCWELTPSAGWVITSGQGTTQIQVTAGSQPATISVRAISGCGISDVSTVDAVPGSAAEINIGAITGPGNTCSNQTELTYSIAPVGGATGYKWSLPPTWKITSGENTNKIIVTAGSQSGEISVVAFNSCITSNPATLSVTLNPAPVAPLQIKDESSACIGLVYTVDAVPGAASYNWLVPKGWRIIDGQGSTLIRVAAPENSREGIIRVTTQTGSCSSAATSLTVDPSIGSGNLQVANVFSPNGDGVNDTWTITNIQNYPDNEVVLINRWGSEVYKAKSYKNNWTGNNLTDGTYYYVLRVKVCDGTYRTQKGYVMIMR
ncbi:DUF3494 domain-containing protein [Adhaeribacter swui]|uniref:DUF3494 domain-containing protein n=1 Tax=Adhaeribacter swui TaxID=2086471 RepID=A0A7G7G5Q9_9BACT|nr:ice-binding family protein [Adhaeribacter swui]QNF32493.1 DUF3494 domain-containing protein [Adhaeribacter swui]